MREVRIHTFQALEPGANLRLEEEPARHLLRVLRLKTGDRVVVFNGDGRDWPARIGAAEGSRRCLLEIGQPRASGTESSLQVHLVQALCKGEKMDWAIRKSVELGVHAIWPVHTSRTDVRLAGDRARKRADHWQRVAIAACEQSGRARVPAVTGPGSIESVLARLPRPCLGIRLDTVDAPGLGEHDPGTGPVAVVVGPEGGLDEPDIRILDGAGFSPASLGPRVLRSETAGPAALAILQSRYGDMA